MPEPASVYDIGAARDARDEALVRVEQHAEPGWNDAAYEAVCSVAAEVGEFTTDRVWWELRQRGIPEPHEPRALGPVMRRASHDGVIEKAGRTHQSCSPINHARDLAVWRSRIYREAS